MVIDTLKDIDPERKCYRLIGGVLVERNVKEVLPALRAKEEGVRWAIQLEPI
jgi:prefoldin subunit 2